MIGIGITYQFRRDTASNWTANNPVLLVGELGLESDTNQVKLKMKTPHRNDCDKYYCTLCEQQE